MAEKKYQVITAAVLAKTESGDLYLYQGAQVPDSVGSDEIKRLVKGDFISEIKVEDAPPSEKPVEIPDGDPTEKWTIPQLQAYAGTLKIDLGDATKKEDIFAAIAAAK